MNSRRSCSEPWNRGEARVAGWWCSTRHGGDCVTEVDRAVFGEEIHPGSGSPQVGVEGVGRHQLSELALVLQNLHPPEQVFNRHDRP